MERVDLKSDEGLRIACKAAEAAHANAEWRARLKEFLQSIRRASAEERASEAFQRTLWEDNPVSGAGMGTVNVENAICDADFRHWLAKQSMREMPKDPTERASVLNVMHKQSLQRLELLCDRMPHLKLLRLFAALFPSDFTTLADRGALRRLQIQMGLKGRVDPVLGHRRVLDRLVGVLDPVDVEDIDATVKRMTLPWMLVVTVNDVESDSTITTGRPGEERLNPLPASRRRRGLISIAGYLESILPILEFAEEGPTREELIDFIRTEKPYLKESSIRTYLNALRSQFNVIALDDDRYVLTERGQALRETGDPDELRDWLLTRIIGIDHVLVALKQSAMNREGLYKLFRKANPGWTTNFAPSAMISWLEALDLISKNQSDMFGLTERGSAWRDWITWEPENLSVVEVDPGDAVTTAVQVASIERPSLAAIIDQISQVAAFSPSLVTSLHLGLWANQRRHFAILTGLSGSGKTLLAREYGKALTRAAGESSDLLCTVPVQPGWYDPTPILGYVNPLSRDTYEGTRFLDLLVHANEHPELPHVAILDEMNLSHPEQYLAPILSAMETGDAIELHSKGERFDGVPGRIPYPSNLVIIGTVNMDETTLGISDKVLDRAYTLEFWEIQIDKWPGWDETGLPAEDTAAVRKLLHDLMAALAPARLHFGWRIINEMVGFLRARQLEGKGISLTEAMDQVVFAKLLPKLRGEDSSRFRKALQDCGEALRAHGLVASQLKVAELQNDLDTIGSARFWR